MSVLCCVDFFKMHDFLLFSTHIEYIRPEKSNGRLNTKLHPNVLCCVHEHNTNTLANTCQWHNTTQMENQCVGMCCSIKILCTCQPTHEHTTTHSDTRVLEGLKNFENLSFYNIEIFLLRGNFRTFQHTCVGAVFGRPPPKNWPPC